MAEQSCPGTIVVRNIQGQYGRGLRVGEVVGLPRSGGVIQPRGFCTWRVRVWSEAVCFMLLTLRVDHAPAPPLGARPPARHTGERHAGNTGMWMVGWLWLRTWWPWLEALQGQSPQNIEGPVCLWPQASLLWGTKFMP